MEYNNLDLNDLISVNITLEKIEKKKRKTIGFKITDKGTLIVKVPFKTNEKLIMDLIKTHKKWIEKTKFRILNHKIIINEYTLKNSGYVLLFGKRYKVVRLEIKINKNFKKSYKNNIFSNGLFFLTYNRKNYCILLSYPTLFIIKINFINNNNNFINNNNNKLKEQLLSKITSNLNNYNFNTNSDNFNEIVEIIEIFFKQIAKVVFQKRANYFSKKYKLRHNKIKISNAKKRWGSCSYKNNINLVWRLVMAPIKIIDYVIVHELVHTIHKNHKKNFWNKVKIIIPDYKNRIKWLKENKDYLIV